MKGLIVLFSSDGFLVGDYPWAANRLIGNRQTSPSFSPGLTGPFSR
jgi:hypothetical protein